MHPEYNQPRRQARVRAAQGMLLRINTEEENVWYTDAAAYRRNDRFAISVVYQTPCTQVQKK
ncbi:hypothetical protein HPB50_012900 [Hyalomma asiaticum]|uniref:Uncharacterized protein n=1 Tax=Hyalomma asiaticum TaxID=266040 RepID=A0ACB7THR6_HYAAI|nr:hypothetical protein HPB50_012900 [Hyalomma asiaticum]